MTSKATLLIRRRRPIGEPADLEPGSIPGASLLRGTAGAGRILHALSELGLRLGDITQALLDIDVDPVGLDRLDVGRPFATVVLGSHLVNVPDEHLRRSFLAAARRHVDGDGDVLVEHHPIDWAETAAPVQPTPGSIVGMEDVRRHPPFVSAVSTFDFVGRSARQPFTARVLSEGELADALRSAGLFIRRRISPTLLLAGPAERRVSPGSPGTPVPR